MSEALIFEKYKRSKPGKRRDRELVFNRVLLILVGCLCLFLLGELIFHFLVAPRLMLRNILISSDLPLSKEEILSVAGFEENSYYYEADAVQIRLALEDLPMVREAAVEKTFPDTLRITLFGRIPLSMLFFTTPYGTSIPVVIDEEGVVFQIGTGISSWDLPVITGVKFKKLEVGAKLPETVQPILRDLSKLKSEDPELYRLISELRLLPQSAGLPEILLYPMQYPVRLRLSDRLDPAVLRNAWIVLDLLAKQQMLNEVGELDMRTGEVVYRMEEG